MSHVMSMGEQGNAWNGTSVTGGTTTSAFEVSMYRRVTAFGNSAGATTITLQYSADGTNFYDGPSVVLAGAGDFYIQADTCAKYARLKNLTTRVITATLAAKN